MDLEGEPPSLEAGCFSLSSKLRHRIFRSLSLAFRGLAPKPPQSLCSLRGLGRLADPPESSERFSKYLDRSLIIECRKTTPF